MQNHYLNTCVRIEIDHIPWLVQYGYVIPAAVNRTSASAWLYNHPWINMSKNKPSTFMTHIDCE